MSLTRRKLLILILSCAFSHALLGCRTPWSGATDNSDAANPVPQLKRTTTPNKPLTPVSKATIPSPRTGSIVTPASVAASIEALASQSGAEEADLDSVLEKLQEVDDLDPAAHAQLMAKLQATKPEYWPLVAEQFRASLAYHEQLVAKENAKRDEAAAAIANETSPAVGRATPLNRRHEGSLAAPLARHPKASPTSSDSASFPLSATGRPSTPIRTLVDPRGIRADGTPDDLSPEGTPTTIALSPGHQGRNRAADEPAAPSEFVTQGATYPISSESRSETDSPAVLPVSLDTPIPPTGTSQLENPVPADVTTKPPPIGDWQELVAKATEDLSRRVADSPATTAEIHQHVSLRILRLLAGNTEKALEPIPHISPVEQDYWSRQLFALATYLDHVTQPDDKRRAAASVVHLDEAAANLHELGSLTLRNLTFCKNVYDYGAYDPYEQDHFAVGQQLSLYVEVDNFHSQSTEKGFCTSLGSTYELLDETGARVDGGEFPDVEDCCRSRRRDFHVQYGLALPKAIQPGKYQLQLVVRDRGSDKIGHASASFEVSGGKK